MIEIALSVIPTIALFFGVNAYFKIQRLKIILDDMERKQKENYQYQAKMNLDYALLLQQHNQKINHLYRGEDVTHIHTAH
jgi:hypothetical protein